MIDKTTHNRNAQYQCRVLRVEDSHIAIRIATQHLENAQCDVMVATSVAEAIAHAEQMTYDYIFMDVGLPDGDGRDAVRAIRASDNSKNLDTPIIGLTAHTDDEIRQDCLKSGMNVVYNKPLRMDLIQSILCDEITPVEHNDSDDEGQGHKESLSTTLPAIDLAAGAKIMQCPEPEVLVLLTQFIASLPKEQQNLGMAYHLNTPDKWKKVNHVIHRMRGACGYCGALELQKICETFETQFHSGAQDDVLNRLYRGTIKAIAALKKQYQQLTQN